MKNKYKNIDVYTRVLMVYLTEKRICHKVSVEEMAEYIGITVNHLKAIEVNGVMGHCDIPTTMLLDYMDRLDLDYSTTFKEVNRRCLEELN